MPLYNVDYHVRFIEFHGPVKEAVVPNEDGSYTILIESTLSREQQRQKFLHALAHIYKHDFEKECSVDLIEKEAHST